MCLIEATFQIEGHQRQDWQVCIVSSARNLLQRTFDR